MPWDAKPLADACADRKLNSCNSSLNMQKEQLEESEMISDEFAEQMAAEVSISCATTCQHCWCWPCQAPVADTGSGSAYLTRASIVERSPCVVNERCAYYQRYPRTARCTYLLVTCEMLLPTMLLCCADEKFYCCCCRKLTKPTSSARCSYLEVGWQACPGCARCPSTCYRRMALMCVREVRLYNKR